MLKISDEEAIKHIIAYDAPPEGFDANMADDRLLRRAGQMPHENPYSGPFGTRPSLQSPNLLKLK